MKTRTFLFSAALAAAACQDRPAPPPDNAAAPSPQPETNPFAHLLIHGQPPPPAERGLLDFRILHARGGSLYETYVAIARGGTSDVVWTDRVSHMKLPLGAGTYDVRIDRLGGPIVKSGIVVRAGETTRVELASDTGVLQLEAVDASAGSRKSATWRVESAVTAAVVWTGFDAAMTLVLPAGVYDVHCERDGRDDQVMGEQVKAGATTVARCLPGALPR